MEFVIIAHLLRRHLFTNSHHLFSRLSLINCFFKIHNLQDLATGFYLYGLALYISGPGYLIVFSFILQVPNMFLMLEYGTIYYGGRYLSVPSFWSLPHSHVLHPPPWCWVSDLDIHPEPEGCISRHPPQNTIWDILNCLSGTCHSSTFCCNSSHSSE